MPSSVLVVEDHAPWGKIFAEMLKGFGEKSPTVLISEAKLLKKLKSRHWLDRFDLCLVDLELGPGTDDNVGPGDYSGRDGVLRSLRDAACWLPVILQSRYITGAPEAVLPRPQSSDNALEWERGGFLCVIGPSPPSG